MFWNWAQPGQWGNCLFGQRAEPGQQDCCIFSSMPHLLSPSCTQACKPSLPVIGWLAFKQA